MIHWLYPTMLCTYLLLLAGCKPGAHEAPLRPNIIYIMADDLGYGDLGCYGQQKFATPHLDQLAREGILFTQHYAGSTVCAPSRSALMTGLHTGHGPIRGNQEIFPEGQAPLPDSLVTVAEILKSVGYTTGIFGKWGLGAPGSEGIPTRQGFHHFFGYLCQRMAHTFYPTYLWEQEEKYPLAGNDTGREIYSHDLVMEKALSFVERHAGGPFFLYLPINIPHAAMHVPADDLEKFAGKFPETPFPGEGNYGAQDQPKAAFAGMMTRMDRDIGRLMALLKTLGIDQNTLVIFTSDNGPHREGGHDPDFFNSNGPLRGYKRDLYEGGIRVPFIARWPEKITPQRTTSHIAAFWDFLPTACELAGAPVPKGLDGISYLPTLLGNTPQATHEYLYWEFHEQGKKQAIRQGDWKLVRLNIAREPDALPQLYHLGYDREEQKDVAGENPEVVARLMALLPNARKAHADWPFFPNETTDQHP
jgi:arylsulfatase A-like enzyme